MPSRVIAGSYSLVVGLFIYLLKCVDLESLGGHSWHEPQCLDQAGLEIIDIHLPLPTDLTFKKCLQCSSLESSHPHTYEEVPYPVLQMAKLNQIEVSVFVYVHLYVSIFIIVVVTFFVHFCFQAGCCSVVQGQWEFEIFLSPSSECWDYRQASQS